MKEDQNYGKIAQATGTSKTVSKMAGGRMHTLQVSQPTPVDPLLVKSYKNHQKSLAYFSHLTPLNLLFLLKGRSSQKAGIAQCSPPKILLTLHIHAMQVISNMMLPVPLMLIT